MINFVFPSSAFIESSSRWGSDSDSGAAPWFSYGCRGSWIWVITFDSCITATLTLFLSSTTPSYVSLFPIPIALSCRTLNVLSSLICSAGGAGDRVGGGDCWDGGAEQVSQVQSLFLQYWAALKITEHFACTHPEHLVYL